MTAISAALLVAYVLVHALLIGRFPWFVDETFYGTNVRAGAADPAHRFDSLLDHKGLIVDWLGIVFVKLGFAPIAALRFVSLLSGIVAAAASGVIVWRWWADEKLALVTAGVVAFLPYLLVHDTVGIIDAFIAALSMVALALQLELARRPRLDLAMLLGITFGALLLAKQTGLLAIALLPLSLVTFDWAPQARLRRLAGWAGYVVVALVIAGAMYAVTRLSPLVNSPQPGTYRSFGDFLRDPFGTIGGTYADAWRGIWGYLTPGGLILALWGLVRVVRTRHLVGIVVALWGLVAIVPFLLLTNYAFPRYGLQLAAPFAILAVLGGADLLVRARTFTAAGMRARRARQALVAVLALAAVVPAVVFDVRMVADPSDAPYAGLDRYQYNTAVSNAGPVQRAARDILRLTPATAAPQTRDTAIAIAGGWVWPIDLAVNGDTYTSHPRFHMLFVTQPVVERDANDARFVIIDGAQPLPFFRLGRHARLVARYTRPNGGPALLLYDRGA